MSEFLNTGVSSLVGVGVAPFAVGAVGSAIVGGVGLVSALTLSELIRRSTSAAAGGESVSRKASATARDDSDVNGGAKARDVDASS